MLQLKIIRMRDILKCFDQAVYGSEQDSSLHLAIKHRCTEAALALIKSGCNVRYANLKVSYK